MPPGSNRRTQRSAQDRNYVFPPRSSLCSLCLCGSIRGGDSHRRDSPQRRRAHREGLNQEKNAKTRKGPKLQATLHFTFLCDFLLISQLPSPIFGTRIPLAPYRFPPISDLRSPISQLPSANPARPKPATGYRLLTYRRTDVPATAPPPPSPPRRYGPDPVRTGTDASAD